MPQGSLASPGPGFVPGLLAALLGVAGAGLLVRAWLRRGVDTAPVNLGHPHIWITLAAFAGVVALLTRLGFVATMTLFLLILFRTYSGRSWLGCALGAALTAGLAYAGFRWLLGVALPAGTWW